MKHVLGLIFTRDTVQDDLYCSVQISRPENRAGSALAGRPGGRAGEQPLRCVTVTGPPDPHRRTPGPKAAGRGGPTVTGGPPGPPGPRSTSVAASGPRAEPPLSRRGRSRLRRTPAPGPLPDPRRRLHRGSSYRLGRPGRATRKAEPVTASPARQTARSRRRQVAIRAAASIMPSIKIFQLIIN